MLGLSAVRFTHTLESGTAMRRSGGPGKAAGSGILDFRFRGGDETIRCGAHPSEIEIGVMFGRRDAREMICQDRPKARPRLDPRIPFFGRLVVVPGHVAKVIERRELGCGGDVGDREMIAGEPAPALDEIPEILEVVREVRMPG